MRNSSRTEYPLGPNLANVALGRHCAGRACHDLLECLSKFVFLEESILLLAIILWYLLSTHTRQLSLHFPLLSSDPTHFRQL